MTQPPLLPLLFSLSKKENIFSDPSNVSNHGRNNEIPFETASSSNVPDATPWVPPEKPPPLTSIELNRSFSLEGMLSRAGSANEVTVRLNRSDTLQTVSYEIEFPSACLVQHVELKICTPLPFVSNEKSPAVDVQRPIEASDNSTSPSTPTPINDQPSLSEPTAKIDANISTPVRARRPRSGRGERPSSVRPPLESTRKVSITDIQFEKGNKNEENASAQNTQSGKAAQMPFIEFEKYFEIQIRYVEGEEEYEPIVRLVETNQWQFDKSSELLSTLQSIQGSMKTESPPTNHQRFTFPISPTDRISLAEDFDLLRISDPEKNVTPGDEKFNMKEANISEDIIIRPTSPIPQEVHGNTPKHRSNVVTALNFRVLGIAKRIVIEIKLLNPINKADIPFDTEHTRRIGIYGHALNETPDAKCMLPLLNIAGKLKTEGNVRHAIEAYILCALSFQSGRKYIQSVELIERAQRLMKSLLCADAPSLMQTTEKPPFANDDADTILRMAKLEALAAEILYINRRESIAAPRFSTAADYWREFCRRNKISKSAIHETTITGAKEGTDSEDDEVSETDDTMNDASTRRDMQSDHQHCAFNTNCSSDWKYASVPEILYHRCKDLTELFLSSLTDQAEYSRNVALNGLQFMVEASGCCIGRQFIPIVSALFSIYTLREEIHSKSLCNSAVERHDAVQSINRCIWVIESSYQLIPKFSPEILAELIESWGWTLISCRTGHEPMAHVYRFLYLALANATTCDLRIPHAVLDAILRDAAESPAAVLNSSIATVSSGNHDGNTAAGDPITELRTVAGKFWSLVVTTILSVPDGNRTINILQYIANQLSVIAASSHPNNGDFSMIQSADDLLSIREVAISERKIALYLDVLDRLSYALKDGRVVSDLHAWAREQAGMNLVEVLVVLIELLEIRLVQKNQTLFENIWTSALYVWEAIPERYHPSISTTVISLLEHFIVTIRDFSPTEYALQALATILGSLQLDVEMIDMFQGSFLPEFCERIPHSTHDESFRCLGSLLFILRDNLDSASLDLIIDCLVDRFTVRSEARNQAVRRLITVILSYQQQVDESSEYEYPYLEWMLKKCLLQNPILTAAALDSTKKCVDSKHQLTEHDLSVEMLVMTDILLDAAKEYHAGHVGKDGNFVGLLALFTEIISACNSLVKHSDLKVVRCAFGIMTGLINLLLEKPNRQNIPLILCYPDGFAVCVKFLCAVAARATCDGALTISVLAALRCLIEKYAAITESDGSTTSFPLLSSDTWKLFRQLFDSASRGVRAATLGTLMRIIPIPGLSKPIFSPSSASDLAIAELDLLLKRLLKSRSWDANHHGLRLLFELAQRYTELDDGSTTEFISLFPNSYQSALDLQDHGRSMIRGSACELTEYLDGQMRREEIKLLDIDFDVMDYAPPLNVQDCFKASLSALKPFLPNESDLSGLNAAWRIRSNRFGLQPHIYQVYWWNRMDIPRENTGTPSPSNGLIQSVMPTPIPFLKEPESMKDFTDPNMAPHYIRDVYEANKITSTLDPHISRDGESQQNSFIIDDADDFQELGIIEMNEDWSGDEDNKNGTQSPIGPVDNLQPPNDEPIKQ